MRFSEEADLHTVISVESGTNITLCYTQAQSPQQNRIRAVEPYAMGARQEIRSLPSLVR